MYLGSFCEKLDNKTLSDSKLKVLEVENIYSFIAKELKIGKIFGIFQNKMEFGPRALGNRSIICSPQNVKINEILNQKLKRSDFMPFAPCVLAEDFKIYLKASLVNKTLNL
jgi:carbamoyltransferase